MSIIKSTTKSPSAEKKNRKVTPQKVPSIRDEILQSMLKDDEYASAFTFSDLQHDEMPSAILEVIVGDSPHKQQELYKVLECCDDEEQIAKIAENFLKTKLKVFAELVNKYANKTENLKEKIVCLKWLKHLVRNGENEVEIEGPADQKELLKLKGKMQMIKS